ncbi:MAG: DNA methyltransferase, partial [Candidatus Cloacimonadales bacterium]|nr:DNA methyltransferase [Candidatus Cloacimonadales bacterium]
MKETQLKKHSLDIKEENIEKIQSLFPEVFKEGKIDFDLLKQLLGEYVEDETERYNFTWNGKGQALRLSQTPSAGTLRPCKEESKDWDTTESLYIEGDNLEVLKLLQKSYYGKVKMIYIDPPYNTGGDFVYPDDFTDSIKNYKAITGQIDAKGKNISSNSETSGRYHTDWLNMMYPRLRLARNLLTDDGVIFISIDDNEVDNLTKICLELFGEDNVEIAIWNKEAEGSSGTLKQISTFRRIHEYIIFAYKNRKNTQFYKINEALKGRENELQTANLAVNRSSEKTDHPNYFTITNPLGDKFTRQWKWSESEIDELIKQDLIYWGSDGRKQPRLIIPTDERRTTFLLSILNYGGTTVGRKDFETLMGNEVEFSYPKPIILLKKIINSVTGNNDTILDFFSGSASTAQAILELNVEKTSNRKYIMVQLPEETDGNSGAFKSGYKNICEIGKERIRRAGESIKAELQKKYTAYQQRQQTLFDDDAPINPDDLDTGFKVLKLDTTNIREWQ